MVQLQTLSKDTLKRKTSDTTTLSSSDQEEHERMIQLTNQFCQNFMCCALRLSSLHDLLEHFENHHVYVDDPFNAAAAPDSKDSGSKTRKASSKNTSDTDTEKENILKVQTKTEFLVEPGQLDSCKLEKHSGPYFTFANTPTTYSLSSLCYYNNAPSNIVTEEAVAFNDAYVKKQKLSHDLSDEMAQFDDDVTFDADHAQHYIEMSGSGNVSASEESTLMTVAPSCLTSDEDDILEYEKDPELAYLKYIKQMKKRAGGRSVTSVYSFPAENVHNMVPTATDPVTGEEIRITTEIKEKAKNYCCLIPGCPKVYRNQNGLKYHIEHSHTPEERELAQRLLKALKEDPTEKPYACHVEGCTKRYRNSNGLKYHMLHHHSDIEL